MIFKSKKRAATAFVAACLLPATALLTIFVIYPTFSIFRISLFKWGGYSPEKTFVGLDNYKILFGDSRFLGALRNSFFLIIVVTAVTFVLSLFSAAALSRGRLKGRNFFRIILYIPNILSTVVIAAVFSAVYDPSRGLLNSIIALFSDRGPILWLGDRKTVIWAIAIAMIWQAIGYYMVMYMSSMAQIPDSLYEAASLEGAGPLRSFFTVTLPGIIETVRTTLTFFIISNINLSFLLVRAMTGGGPDGASEVLLSYMYKQAYTNSSYGYGMAVGCTVFVFSFALAGLFNFMTRQKE